MSTSNPYAAKSERKPVVKADPTKSVPSGTIDEVLGWVNGDEDRAKAAIAVEESGNKRTTLLNKLKALIDG